MRVYHSPFTKSHCPVYSRSLIRTKSVADPQIALRMRQRELTAARLGYGYITAFTYCFGVMAGGLITSEFTGCIEKRV